jgi:ABC-type lipoprotein export system ATPase subunit
MIFLDSICKKYSSGNTTVSVLHGVSLHIEAGEFCAITGASGSGKTTLLNIIGSLDRPTSGRYLYQGMDLTQPSDDRSKHV